MGSTNRSVLMHLMILLLEGMDEICCHSSIFLIRPTPTHNNSLGRFQSDQFLEKPYICYIFTYWYQIGTMTGKSSRYRYTHLVRNTCLHVLKIHRVATF